PKKERKKQRHPATSSLLFFFESDLIVTFQQHKPPVVRSGRYVSLARCKQESSRALGTRWCASERKTRMCRISVGRHFIIPLGLLITSLSVFQAESQTISYNFNDNALPAGTSLSGVATIGGPAATDGILHLTDDLQGSANGVFLIPDPAGGKRVG